MHPTQQLSQRIAASSFEQLAPAATEVAKQALLDFIGVTLAGVDEPLAKILRAQAQDAGGNPQASILGTSERGNVEQAALINGAAGHAHDYDDVHNAMSGHPTVPVAPAVLALGQRLASSGRDLITAFTAGIDTECILGRYAGPRHYADGWHNTGTLGAFGAAAAAARLCQLDDAATARALGIAGTRAAGLKSQFGTMCKPLHAGHAAATGLNSALLAAGGYGSCNDVLENPQGFMATQAQGASEQRFEEALALPGYTQDICFKYHAACYLTHSAIEATRQLTEQNAFDPNQIEDIEVRVDKGHFRVCNIAEPSTGLEAKFSLRLTTAMALTGLATSSITLFDDKIANDPELNRYRDLVRVTAHEGKNPDTVVVITTRDGARFTAACNVAIPSRDLDAQWRRLEQKFLNLAEPVIGPERSATVIALCHKLDALEELEPLHSALENRAA